VFLYDHYLKVIVTDKCLVYKRALALLINPLALELNAQFGLQKTANINGRLLLCTFMANSIR
jgi:hypothetical protein